VTRYVEFFGVAGAGKTTAYKHLRRELRRRRARVESIEDRAIRVLMANARLSLRGLRFRWGNRSPAHKDLKRIPTSVDQPKHRAVSAFYREHREFADYVFERPDSRISPLRNDELPLLGWMLELLWSYQLATDHGGDLDVLLRDEGFCQRAISIFAFREALSLDAVRAGAEEYFALMPAPAMVVVVRVDPGRLSGRFGARSLPARMKRLSDGERSVLVQKAATCVDAGVRVLRRRGVEIADVANDGSAATLQERMRVLARDLLRRAPPHPVAGGVSAVTD
jgi:hypothetical protein